MEGAGDHCCQVFSLLSQTMSMGQIRWCQPLPWVHEIFLEAVHRFVFYSEPMHMKTFIYQTNVGKQKVKRIIPLFILSLLFSLATKQVAHLNQQIRNYYSYCVENLKNMSSAQLILEISSLPPSLQL